MSLNARDPRPASAASWVEESWREGGALVERIVYRVPMALDAMERPCADCEVGEPHVCPTLRERLVVTYG